MEYACSEEKEQNLCEGVQTKDKESSDSEEFRFKFGIAEEADRYKEISGTGFRVQARYGRSADKRRRQSSGRRTARIHKRGGFRPLLPSPKGCDRHHEEGGVIFHLVRNPLSGLCLAGREIFAMKNFAAGKFLAPARNFTPRLARIPPGIPYGN